MGISRQGIHGNYRKRVGNVVARKVRGRVVLSIYQPDVSNPRTPKQVAQREEFVGVIRALNAFAALAKETARDWYDWGTGWSNFVKANYRFALDPGSVQFQNLVIARGTLMGPLNPSATSEAEVVTISWTDNSGEGTAMATDVAFGVLYNSAKDVVLFNDLLGKREDREGAISVPSNWAGDNVEVWLFFKREDGSAMSASVYLGSIAVD